MTLYEKKTLSPDNIIHFVNGRSLKGPFDSDLEVVTFGMGCFWGVERMFWNEPGVFMTAVGYSGGESDNPTYREVCTGKTGHNEVVKIHYDPKIIGYDRLLKLFWEGHDPTQGMRQGNDIGTQYRSGIYTSTEYQKLEAINNRDSYQKKLIREGFANITTEIIPEINFFYAEDYHQQYLAKNPMGYCGIGGTGVTL